MHETIGRFRSTTLAGAELAVPDDLGIPTLMAFAYRQHQQRDADSWLRCATP